jgi:hypothetical protein
LFIEWIFARLWRLCIRCAKVSGVVSPPAECADTEPKHGGSCLEVSRVAGYKETVGETFLFVARVDKWKGEFVGVRR